MMIKNPNLKTYTTFKQMIQVLRIINVQAAQLHYTGGVHACIRCGEIPNQPVAIPCGHVGCKNCLNDFFNPREGHKRYPAASCKNPEIAKDIN